MYLNNNTFTGAVPAQLGNLASLTELYLNDNQLTGDVPVAFDNLRRLSKCFHVMYYCHETQSSSPDPKIANHLLLCSSYRNAQVGRKSIDDSGRQCLM